MFVQYSEFLDVFCTRFGSRRRPHGFLQIVLSNRAYQRILLRTDTDTFCSTQRELSVKLRFSRISLVVRWASSCWAQTQNKLAGLQRTFTNPSARVVQPDTPGFIPSDTLRTRLRPKRSADLPWTLSLCPKGIAPSTPSVVVPIILPHRSMPRSFM